MDGIDEIGDSESKETNSAAGIVPGRQVESAFESGRSGESACGSGPRSEPKYGRLRHAQSRWADSRRDARPPGPIVIVQSYGAVWSTEKHAQSEAGSVGLPMSAHEDETAERTTSP